MEFHPHDLYMTTDHQLVVPAEHGSESGSDQMVKQRRSRRRKTNKGEGGSTRKMMRKLSEEQANYLERNFIMDQKLETERKDKLAMELGLDPRQVAVWFQNRRARWKAKKLEQDYSNLKNQHNDAVMENCRLQTEVMKLKEQLSEAEKHKQKLLMEQFDGVSSFISFSPETMDILERFSSLGEIGMMEGFDCIREFDQWGFNLI